MSALPYLLVYVVPVVYAVGAARLGAWPLLVPALVFALIPLFDEFMGHDRDNPDEAEVEARRANPLFDGLLRAWLPVQLLVIGVGVWRAASGDGSAPELALLAVACGLVTVSGGINVAHELMHRAEKGDRALAEVLMVSVSYPWFCVEHVLGHHRRVATPDDPGTARLGESLYAFLPRTLLTSLTSAWTLEAQRVARRKLQPFGWQDRRMRYAVELGVVYAALAWYSPAAVAFFAVQSATAVVLLEVINYIEHYGLVRERVSSDRYERVQPHHSWNSTHRLTSRFLFNLPRHADHHAWASRPYWQLRDWDDAPVMPHGYPTMLMMALFPPLWRRVMDPRVRAVSTVHGPDPTAATTEA